MKISYSDLSSIRATHNKEKMAYTAGCFDVLHTGHLEILQHLGNIATVGVVGITPDSTVNAKKGPLRPIQPAETRAAILDAIKGVHYTLITPEKVDGFKFVGQAVLSQLKPDYFLTGDKAWENDREWIEALGTEMQFIDREEGGESTSQTVHNLLNRLPLLQPET